MPRKNLGRSYERKNTHSKRALAVEILLTCGIGLAVVLAGWNNLYHQAGQYAADVENDYQAIIRAYVTTFRTMTLPIREEITKNPSFEEMQTWLQNREPSYQAAIGTDVYDGIAITYKGGYAHSWNYGDYTDYDPTTRPWYQQAQQADGEVTVVAPYVTFLDSSDVGEDAVIILTIAQKYSDEISFDLDLKVGDIQNLLTDRSLLYDNSRLLLYDPQGYVLSCTDNTMFAHNVRTPDDKVSQAFCDVLARAEASPDVLQLDSIDGKLCYLYLSRDESGNTICLQFSFWEVLWQNFFAIIVIALLLIGLEIYLYLRERASTREFQARDARLSSLASATYENIVYVDAGDFRFYGNAEAREYCASGTYEELYAAVAEHVAEAERRAFSEFLSREALARGFNADNRIESRRFAMRWPLHPGAEEQRTIEISRMPFVADGAKTYGIGYRDVTESAEVLKDALKQAKSANVAKSQFLSRMSHEIRTPMNAIVGLTTIAKQHENDPQKINDYLTKIDTSSKVLLNIINDVLDMSAIENNKLKIACEEFDIKQVLTGISTIYYPQCEAKGIRFEMVTNLTHEMLRGDSLRVSQILLNLVSNAFKFTDKGGTIRIGAEETAQREKTAFVRFTVTDTGAGMTKDMQERLFKPFEQENATTAQKHGGSGLGLSIAKNLVDMMHGAIRVESEKGKGTTFTVDVPFTFEENAQAADSTKVRTLRVLAADDDPTAREYTAIVLKRIGVPFEMAASGREALAAIEQAQAAGRPYDVVLLDWKMTDMDGVEVARRIRQENTQKAAVIIMSAYDLNQVEDKAKAAGADYFVCKPLFQSTLFDVLMNLTGGSLYSGTAAPLPYDFTGRRVLLAEDNELNAEIATELLGMVNMQLDHAENGRLAVEMFRDAPPGTYDVILMDVQMPEMNGYEAARAIRALDRPDARTIPVIAMTANAFTEDVAQALSAGMDGHIAKPIDTKILYGTLQKAVSGQEMRKDRRAGLV